MGETVTTIQSEKGRRELKGFAERIVRLEGQQAKLKEEMAATKADIKEVYGEAQSTGFNAKALKIAVAEMQMDAESRQMKFDFEAEVDLYRTALGIAPDDDNPAAYPGDRAFVGSPTAAVAELVPAE